MMRLSTIILVGVIGVFSLSIVSGAASKKAAPRLSAPTKAQIAAAQKQGKIPATLVTTKGTIALELNGTAAPIATANFINLVRAGLYNGMPVHRVEPGFVMQAGDPIQKGLPTAGYSIPDERSPLKHIAGAVAMARTYKGGQMMPNSASTQFYITLGEQPHLDQLGFTVFGKVVSGMNVVQRTEVGDKIIKATIGKVATSKKK